MDLQKQGQKYMKRNYHTRMNINNTRVWFRYRSKMTIRDKANISSEFRNDMGCNSDKIESQDPLEIYTETQDLKTDLKMNIEKDHIVVVV